MKQMLQRIIGEDIDLITELSPEVLPVCADKGQMEQIRHIPWSAKFGGATGNFNAHAAAYPEIDWAAIRAIL